MHHKTLKTSAVVALLGMMTSTTALAQSISDSIGVSVRVKYAPAITLEGPPVGDKECTDDNGDQVCKSSNGLLCFKTSEPSIKVSVSSANGPVKGHFAMSDKTVADDFFNYNFATNVLGGQVLGVKDTEHNWATNPTKTISLTQATRGAGVCGDDAFAFSTAISFDERVVALPGEFRSIKDYVTKNKLRDNVERKFSDTLTITISPNLVRDPV